jgi:hypothetical protein
VPGGIGRGRRNARKHQGKHEKERAERTPLRRRRHNGMLVAWPATFAGPLVATQEAGNVVGQTTVGPRIQSLAQPRGA